jgi:hypothetical protein
MPVAAASQIANERLNDLLIDAGRSLLQYTSESWPWAASNEGDVKASLDRMAAEQHDVVAALADLLASRGHAIDFGTYPTEYTSLHYVAVDFLLGQLVENQKAVLARCESVADRTSADDPAKSLMDDIVTSERKHVKELQALLTSHPAR